MSSAESVVWSDEMAVAKQVWVLQLDSGDFVKLEHSDDLTLLTLQTRLNLSPATSIILSRTDEEGISDDFPPGDDGVFTDDSEPLPHGLYQLTLGNDADLNSETARQTPFVLDDTSVSESEVDDGCPLPAWEHDVQHAQCLVKALDAARHLPTLTTRDSSFDCLRNTHNGAFVAAASTIVGANVRLLIGVTASAVLVAIDVSKYLTDLLTPSAAPTPLFPNDDFRFHTAPAVHPVVYELASTLPMETILALMQATDLVEEDNKTDSQQQLHDERSSSSSSSSSSKLKEDTNAANAPPHQPQPQPSARRSKSSLASRLFSSFRRNRAKEETSDSDKSEDTRRRRKLIFCGHSFSGPVAHVAAILARRALKGLKEAKMMSASAITFSSPVFSTVALVSYLQRDHDAQRFHLNICQRADGLLEAMNLCINAHTAFAVSGYSNSITQEYFTPLLRLLTGGLDRHTLERLRGLHDPLGRALDGTRQSANEDACRFVPLAWHSFVAPAIHRRQPCTTTSTQAVIDLTKDALLNAQYATLTSHHEASWPDNDDSAIAGFVPRLNRSVASPLAPLKHVLPKVASVLLALSPHGTTITLTGCALDGLLRTVPALSKHLHDNLRSLELPSDSTSNMAGVDVGMMVVKQCNYSSAEVFVPAYCITKPGALRTHTLFGSSPSFSFSLDNIKNTDNDPARTTNAIFNSTDTHLLYAAFARGLLYDAKRLGQSQPLLQSPSNPYLYPLQELETILLGTDGLASLREHTKTFQDISASAERGRATIYNIAMRLALPLNIEYHTYLGRAARNFLSAASKAFGYFLAVTGGIAALPGTLLMLPGIITMDRTQNMAAQGVAAVVSVPGMLLSGPGLLVGIIGGLTVASARGAKRDMVARNYIHTVQLLLQMFSVDELDIPSDIGLAEHRLLEVYRELAQLFFPPADDSADLRQATPLSVAEYLRMAEVSCKIVYEDVVARVADTGVFDRALNGLFETRHDGDRVAEARQSVSSELDKRRVAIASGFSFYAEAMPEAKQQIHRSLCSVARIAQVRDALENELVLSFVGVHNAGKSTTIEKLFGFCTGASLLERTEEVKQYSLTEDIYVEKSISNASPTSQPASPSASSSEQFQFTVCDFPGTTDERLSIALHTERFVHASTLCVVVFRAGHVGKPEVDLINTLKQANQEFIILMNKSDDVKICSRIGDDVQRQNFCEDYAHRLDVPPDCFVFLSALNSLMIEMVRQRLWLILITRFPQSSNVAILALCMIPAATRTQLLPDFRRHDPEWPRQLLLYQPPALSPSLSDMDNALPRSFLFQVVDSIVALLNNPQPTLITYTAVMDKVHEQTVHAYMSPATKLLDAFRCRKSDTYDKLVQEAQFNGLSADVQLVLFQVCSERVWNIANIQQMYMPSSRFDSPTLSRRAACSNADWLEDPTDLTNQLSHESDALLVHVADVTSQALGLLISFRIFYIDLPLPTFNKIAFNIISAQLSCNTVNLQRWVFDELEEEFLKELTLLTTLDETKDTSRSEVDDNAFEMQLVRGQIVDTLAQAVRVTFRLSPQVPPKPTLQEQSMKDRMALFRERLQQHRVETAEAKAEVAPTAVQVHLLSDPNRQFECFCELMCKLDSHRVLLSRLHDSTCISLLSVSIDKSKIVTGFAALVEIVRFTTRLFTSNQMRSFWRSSSQCHFYFGDEFARRPNGVDWTPLLYRMIGRVVGLVLQDERLRNAFSPVFALPVFRLLLGRSLELFDLALIDTDLNREISLLHCHLQTRPNCLYERLHNQHFVAQNGVAFATADNLAAVDVLSVNGHLAQVTVDSQARYLIALIRYHLGAALPLKEFLEGFRDVGLPLWLLSFFTAPQLQVLACDVVSRARVSIAHLRDILKVPVPTQDGSASEYQGATWLWQCLENFCAFDKALFLVLLTGTCAIGPTTSSYHVIWDSWHASDEPVTDGHHASDAIIRANLPTCTLHIPMFPSYDQLEAALHSALEQDR